jgi:diaminohydroxyphosphoribosylaminopyrimidine deaminase/5-amino-6-(5-phosphoribosylamino)uracil reductase
VHYAVADPNPVAAGGAHTLRAAGIDVQRGQLAGDVELGPLRAWLHFARTGRPHVTWKYASTLDGRVAAADGTSRWISSPESRAEVHVLRGGIDAIMVGTGTVLADDPALTARAADGTLARHQPLRVVVGTGEIPAGARVLDGSAETVRVRSHDPDAVLALLAERGVVDLLLEGGPRLAGAFVGAGRVDRILAYLAPALLGSGPMALGDAGVSTITGVHRWSVERVTMSGGDVRVSAVPLRGSE